MVPPLRPSRIVFRSDAVRKRFNSATLIGYGANRSDRVRQCCWASTVVGASMATCFPAVIALKMARMATSVLPKPTSPQTRRSIGSAFSMSRFTSAVAFS